ncbi:PaaI family thioesterase [Leptospira sp. WS92.C1]
MNNASQWELLFFQIKMFLKCPVYWRCGGRVVNYSKDFLNMKVKLPFKHKTRGWMGTHFGGSLYAFVDPIPLLLLKYNLGENYILWDTNGAIQYLKATSQDVFAEIKILPETLNQIQEECHRKKKTLLNLNIDIQEKNGDLVAKVGKTIYVRRKLERKKYV